jgi:tetratricopeptide (TPR) repeat protein
MDAHALLLNTAIPAAAEELDAETEDATDSELSEFLHARGINMRYLLAVAQHCKQEKVRHRLCEEAILRAIKRGIRELWQSSASVNDAVVMADGVVGDLIGGQQWDSVLQCFPEAEQLDLAKLCRRWDHARLCAGVMSALRIVPTSGPRRVLPDLKIILPQGLVRLEERRATLYSRLPSLRGVLAAETHAHQQLTALFTRKPDRERQGAVVQRLAELRRSVPAYWDVNWSLARFYLMQEDGAAAAMPFLRDALDDRRRVYGPDHAMVALMLATLASAQHVLGDPDSARSSYLDALRIFRECAAPSSRILAEVSARLGGVLYKVGAYAEAAACLQDAVAAAEVMPQRPNALLREIYGYLAPAFRLNRCETDALNAYRNLLAVTIADKGEADTALGPVLLELASTHLSLGQCEHAARCYEQAMSFLTDPAHAIQQATALHGLGTAYWRAGRPQTAAQHCEEALKILAEQENTTDAALVARTLASVYATLNARKAARMEDMAEELAERALQASGEAAADKDEDTDDAAVEEDDETFRSILEDAMGKTAPRWLLNCWFDSSARGNFSHIFQSTGVVAQRAHAVAHLFGLAVFPARFSPSASGHGRKRFCLVGIARDTQVVWNGGRYLVWDPVASVRERLPPPPPLVGLLRRVHMRFSDASKKGVEESLHLVQGDRQRSEALPCIYAKLVQLARSADPM